MNTIEHNNKSPQRTITFNDNCVQSTLLFASAKELTIMHNSEAYKLRLTGNGKLILTK